MSTFFFRHVFDEFGFIEFSEKGYRARCFGKSFGSSEEVREGFLGHPGGVQEASWEHFGGFESVYEAIRFNMQKPSNLL